MEYSWHAYSVFISAHGVLTSILFTAYNRQIRQAEETSIDTFTSFRERLGDENLVSLVILQYDDITRDNLSILHVCQQSLINRVDPVRQPLLTVNMLVDLLDTALF